MRLLAPTCLAVVAVCAPASAGFVSAAVIDDFSGAAGLGFSRSSVNGASLSGGSGLLSNGGGFQYLLDSPGFDAPPPLNHPLLNRVQARGRSDPPRAFSFSADDGAPARPPPAARARPVQA